ncbi:MAG: PIN domain-containing protein [Nitrospirae bacterium]|nr:PIN domain-containing protein [Nitrospirota bacterium]
MDKVLVDTSVWIEFFRKRDPWYVAVSGLMDDKRVCCAGIILAELIQGAKSEKELQVLRDFRHIFPFIEESVDLWQAAGELSHVLLRKGKSVGLSDCYLAVAAKTNKLKVLTLDKHFELIKGLAGISLYEVR